jgi:adenine-specific DNA methylase
VSAPYPKRLVEVDLPIREISTHARREKSVGPISTLHVWWARRNRPVSAIVTALSPPAIPP